MIIYIYIYHTEDLEFSIVRNNKNIICILGLCIDLYAQTTSLNNICSRLLVELNKSLFSFYDAVDYLAGRFVIIYRHNEQIFIMNDACAMLKINYDLQTHTIGSNIFLLNNIFREGQGRFHKYYRTIAFKQGAFGDDLPLEGMKILTPNHEINFQNFSIRRFYPRKPLKETSDIIQVSTKIIEYIRIQERLLSKKFQLLFSCTSGLDSRFTLAALKNAREHNFFVYCIDDMHCLDLIISNEICKKLDLKLFINTTSKYNIFTKFMNHNIIFPDNTFNIDIIKKMVLDETSL